MTSRDDILAKIRARDIGKPNAKDIKFFIDDVFYVTVDRATSSGFLRGERVKLIRFENNNRSLFFTSLDRQHVSYYVNRNLLYRETANDASFFFRKER